MLITVLQANKFAEVKVGKMNWIYRLVTMNLLWSKRFSSMHVLLKANAGWNSVAETIFRLWGVPTCQFDSRLGCTRLDCRGKRVEATRNEQKHWTIERKIVIFNAKIVNKCCQSLGNSVKTTSWFWTPNTFRQQCNGKNSVLTRFIRQ